jgi:hypoxanthine phosphoribosyltransferase
MKKLEKDPMSWSEFGELSEKFVGDLKEMYQGKVNVVIGIAKGGLPLSVSLANNLSAAWDSIRIRSYEDTERKGMELVHGLHADITGKTVMLVDDIVDEGETMLFALDYLRKNYKPKKVITAALILRSHSKFVPDHYSQEREKWVKFPWEAENK